MLKLYLNGPALERLLGGNSDLEVGLRQQIVEEFAKKHLKQLVNEPTIAMLVSKVKDEIKKYVGEEVWDWRTGEFKAVIHSHITELMKKSLSVVIDQLAKFSFDELITSYQKVSDDRITRYELKLMNAVNAKIDNLLKELDRKLDERTDQHFEQRVQAEVQRRLQAALETK